MNWILEVVVKWRHRTNRLLRNNYRCGEQIKNENFLIDAIMLQMVKPVLVTLFAQNCTKIIIQKHEKKNQNSAIVGHEIEFYMKLNCELASYLSVNYFVVFI